MLFDIQRISKKSADGDQPVFKFFSKKFVFLQSETRIA